MNIQKFLSNVSDVWKMIDYRKELRQRNKEVAENGEDHS